MPGALNIRWSRPLGGKPTTVIVSKDQAGRYFVSIRAKETIRVKPITPNMVGIDLGLSHVAILSSGEKIGNPRFLKKRRGETEKSTARPFEKEAGI
jgi:putative transposase